MAAEQLIIEAQQREQDEIDEMHKILSNRSRAASISHELYLQEQAKRPKTAPTILSRAGDELKDEEFRLPVEEIVLSTLESIIHGELYFTTFTWEPFHQYVEFKARCFTNQYD